ncbi:pickpocket protein 19-like [Haematobia irritans]|uniref:pickpocket protein 19-like n=1 Tax=Haematobia irritans TaxID=7368 RepID=UPI003F4FDEC9
MKSKKFLRDNDDNQNKWAELKAGIIEDILHITTVHGLNRIFQKTSKRIQRLLFSLGFITACLIFIDITWVIAYIYSNHPLKTVIEDLHYPVFKIPFPEVIICNKNRLNWQRYNEAKERFLQKQHQTQQHEDLFKAILNAYNTFSFGKFDNFENISDLYPPILLKDLDYMDFSLIAEFMAWRCNEILTDCYWQNQSYDCCDIFAARKSTLGHCLAFNSIETDVGMKREKSDPYYPWRALGQGPLNGLRLRIYPNVELDAALTPTTKGIKVMLVEPYVWSYIGRDIASNTRAMISITARLHYFDATTRMFPSNVRKCVFVDELESLFYKSLKNRPYMFENCQSQCQQEYLMKFCNCTIDMFFPPDNYRACRLRDLPCLYQHNDFLQVFEQVGEHEYVAQHKSGMDCPCFYNCRSLEYFPDVKTDTLSYSDEITSNNTEILLEVYFMWDTIMKYETTAVYTIIDLMASLGGLASLCIGCSLLGVTELLFFFFVHLPKRLIVCSIAARRTSRSVAKEMVNIEKVSFNKISPTTSNDRHTA